MPRAKPTRACDGDRGLPTSAPATSWTPVTVVSCWPLHERVINGRKKHTPATTNKYAETLGARKSESPHVRNSVSLRHRPHGDRAPQSLPMNEKENGVPPSLIRCQVTHPGRSGLERFLSGVPRRSQTVKNTGNLAAGVCICRVKRVECGDGAGDEWRGAWAARNQHHYCPRAWARIPKVRDERVDRNVGRGLGPMPDDLDPASRRVDE